MQWLEFALAATAVSIAATTRPWRIVAAPPWIWLAWCAMLPMFWGADRYVTMPVAQPLSGACLLMLMMGWPLAVLAMLPIALLTMWFGDLTFAEALSRYVWLGLLPASLAMGLGAALRRWLPHNLFVYILGRGFFATAIAGIAAAAVGIAMNHQPIGLSAGDLFIARTLTAWGDAFIAGMFAAIFVAFRPEWLATYADRLYLPARPRP